MTFLSPHFILIGVAFSAAVAAVHFIVTRQPRSEIFPTARFVPVSAVEAVSRSRHPSDLLLLLLRVLAVLCVAFALARPVLTPSREQTARIILADASATPQEIGALRDSVAKYFRSKDVLIAFDSTARIIASTDSIKASATGVGRLSPALIVALRLAAKLRDRADSISLIVVSPLPAASWDAATDTIRSLWPGSIQIVRLTPRADSAHTQLGSVGEDLTVSDPLRFALTLASTGPHAEPARLVRSDIVSATEPNEMTLHWPSVGRPVFASPAPPVVHAGVVVGRTVVFGAFTTRFAFTPDSLAGATVVARWIDGSPAAVQRNSGNACIRSASIPVPQKGDLVIRPEFVSLVERLIAPCAPAVSVVPLSDSLVLKLKGGTHAASRASFATDDAQQSPFALWLLLAALILLAIEQMARRTHKVAPVTPDADRVGVAA